MKVYDFTNINKEEIKESNIFTYNQQNVDLSQTVSDIITKVQKEGIQACLELTEKFDKVSLSEELLITSYNNFKDTDIDDTLFKESFFKAKENIYNFHKNQTPNTFTKNYEDYNIKEKWVPLSKVGCYIPGGSAPLISTILMTVIPAKIAGVENITVCTPPTSDGNINPYMLWACKELKVNQILKLGGSQAIAAMAFGIENCPKVDKIVGPGNKYVTEAKKQLYGQVDIDMLAGPSEVCIIADEQTPEEYIAADILSQLEHDKDAIATIVTTSQEPTDKLEKELKQQAKKLSRQDIIDDQNLNLTVIKVKNTDQIKTVVDLIAPEHLEIMTKDLSELKDYPFKAGVIFAGNYTPVSVGDFYGGTNHVLPTNQRASFSSPLSVYDFYRRINFLEYTKEKLSKERKYIEKFAETEMLDAHKNAISIRFNKNNN